MGWGGGGRRTGGGSDSGGRRHGGCGDFHPSRAEVAGGADAEHYWRNDGAHGAVDVGEFGGEGPAGSAGVEVRFDIDLLALGEAAAGPRAEPFSSRPATRIGAIGQVHL